VGINAKQSRANGLMLNFKKTHLQNAIRICVYIATGEVRKNASISMCQFSSRTDTIVLPRGTGPLEARLAMLGVG
jgi:hypothetical protein